MSRNIDFAKGEYYHVFTRGVDQRQTFMSPADHERFHQSAFLFNDVNYAHNSPEDKLMRMCLIETTQYDTREKLVDIITFNYLSNHFHMLCTPLVEDGISLFMHRFLMGYAKYFNLKYERRGTLFETFEARHIDSDAYLEHIILYIHSNAFDLFGIPWRTGGVKDWTTALAKLEEHPWSGHHILMGQPQAYPVVNSERLVSMYDSPEDYISHLKAWATRDVPKGPFPSLRDGEPA